MCERSVYTQLQDQIDASVLTGVAIWLGPAPLMNPYADFRGGTCLYMKNGNILYSPPNDKLNRRLTQQYGSDER